MMCSISAPRGLGFVVDDGYCSLQSEFVMVCGALGSCYHFPETILSEVSSHTPGTFGVGSACFSALASRCSETCERRLCFGSLAPRAELCGADECADISYVAVPHGYHQNRR